MDRWGQCSLGSAGGGTDLNWRYAIDRLQEHHKKELLATFWAIPPSEKADFLKELNVGGAGEVKDEDGVDADERGKEAAVYQWYITWKFSVFYIVLQIATCTLFLILCSQYDIPASNASPTSLHDPYKEGYMVGMVGSIYIMNLFIGMFSSCGAFSPQKVW